VLSQYQVRSQLINALTGNLGLQLQSDLSTVQSVGKVI
jgi:hypothetical protein